MAVECLYAMRSGNNKSVYYGAPDGIQRQLALNAMNYRNM